MFQGLFLILWAWDTAVKKQPLWSLHFSLRFIAFKNMPSLKLFYIYIFGYVGIVSPLLTDV